MTLLARTRRLDGDVDLVAVAGRDGVLFEKGRSGLAGRGCAARLPWPGGDPAGAARAVAAALAEIEVDDEVGAPGCGPVACGALPFAPGAAAELVVPETVVGRSDDGTRWLTTIAPPGDPAHDRATVPSPDGPAAAPRRFTVAPTIDPDDWCALVERATKMLADGGTPGQGRPGGSAIQPSGTYASEPSTSSVHARGVDASAAASGLDAGKVGAGDEGVEIETIEKVVLAREIVVSADRPIDRLALLDRLRRRFPGCHLVSIDGLVAASPELLVSRTGDVVRSHPMAGTAPRGGDPTADQRLAASLLASAKDRQEHQITIDMVHDTLLPWCSYVDYEAEPSVVAVANVQHLATLVEGRLSRPSPSVLELVAALHPTPAVAGSPRDAAVRWIGRHEGLDRRRYAGTAGWADARGNGMWAVAVRCAELDGPVARLFAGNGVVHDSDPGAELAETNAKLEAMLTAVVRP